ncbi:hypothetical protein [Porphyromonas gingivicanis]|uniref:hypothetical protein n=1 Tax=Porphyromonas gingivicanis TaxID=266762 RepID=UPI000B1CC38B|nr:hypothetical protein [Porphyromonas gingivicanis]
MIELLLGVIFILLVAGLIIWAIWGRVPWKVIGKILLTLLTIGITIALLLTLLSDAFA